MKTMKRILPLPALLVILTTSSSALREEATSARRSEDSNSSIRHRYSNRNRNLRRNTAETKAEQNAAVAAASYSRASSSPQLIDGTSERNTRYLAHGEKRKQRKKNKNKSNDININANVSSSQLQAINAETASSESVTTSASDAEPTMTTANATPATANTIEATTTTTSSSTSNTDNYENRKQIHQIESSMRALSTSHSNLHVNYVYTYGAPSVVKGPAMSNPNNQCIPGTRIYTEDVDVVSCAWWQKLWCTPGEQITNVDFAAQVNAKEGYPHPKMATLVIRLRDGSNVDYTYKPCRDSQNKNQYNYQWWPQSNLASDFLPGANTHNLDKHYEQRLMQIPKSIRGPSLEYVSVARCSYQSSYNKVKSCLNRYDEETSSRIGGVSVLGWKAFAFMAHERDGFLSDSDAVYVLKNDRESSRKCIIGFQGSDHMADLGNFLMSSNDATDYCGRSGVHKGVSNELWKITHDPQYANVIVPALETCHEVTCVGHSLGGALCNAFTMCANQGLENLKGENNSEMWDDYNSLIWNKKGSR